MKHNSTSVLTSAVLQPIAGNASLLPLNIDLFLDSSAIIFSASIFSCSFLLASSSFSCSFLLASSSFLASLSFFSFLFLFLSAFASAAAVWALLMARSEELAQRLGVGEMTFLNCCAEKDLSFSSSLL